MRKWYVIAAGFMALFLAGLIYVTSESRATVSAPELALREGVAPVQGVFATVTRWAEEAVDALISLPHLRAENRTLRRTIAVLEAELFAVQNTKRENEQLRELLNIEPLLPPQSVIARVMARSAEHWFETVTLNRGSRHGLRPGMPVIDKNGAVGHIESVTPNTARVILLINPKSAVGGMVLHSGMPVLVEGTGDPTGNRALVQPLERGFSLAIGDEIITSGMSRIFPKGIPIGRIEQVDQKSQQLRSDGVLKPYVDFSRLDWVSVVLDPTNEVYWPDLVLTIEPEVQGTIIEGSADEGTDSEGTAFE